MNPTTNNCTFFLTGGIAHFVYVDFFILAMPDYFNYHKELVIISGMFEMIGAISMLVPKTRWFAAYGLMVLVIPDLQLILYNLCKKSFSLS